jgi:hypothetical protein
MEQLKQCDKPPKRKRKFCPTWICSKFEIESWWSRDVCVLLWLSITSNKFTSHTQSRRISFSRNKLENDRVSTSFHTYGVKNVKHPWNKMVSPWPSDVFMSHVHISSCVCPQESQRGRRSKSVVWSRLTPSSVTVSWHTPKHISDLVVCTTWVSVH